MKLYSVTIKGKLIEGIEINSGNSFLRQIKSDNGDIHTMPFSHKVWESKEERTVALFTMNSKKLSVDDIMVKYHLTREEAKTALEEALEKYPDKFI